MINRPMHIYEYVQSHIIILQQHVSATPVTINRVPYKKNIIKIQLVVKKSMTKHTILHSIFFSAPYGRKISNYIIDTI